MDHRCLYGHRIPSAFVFAIQSRQCPMCGAPSVTVLGYQVARRLAEELKIDALVAFNSLSLIERDYTLVKVGEGETAAPEESESEDLGDLGEAEFEVSEDDLPASESEEIAAEEATDDASSGDGVEGTFGRKPIDSIEITPIPRAASPLAASTVPSAFAPVSASKAQLFVAPRPTAASNDAGVASVQIPPGDPTDLPSPKAAPLKMHVATSQASAGDADEVTTDPDSGFEDAFFQADLDR